MIMMKDEDDDYVYDDDNNDGRGCGIRNAPRICTCMSTFMFIILVYSFKCIYIYNSVYYILVYYTYIKNILIYYI